MVGPYTMACRNKKDLFCQPIVTKEHTVRSLQIKNNEHVHFGQKEFLGRQYVFDMGYLWKF